MCPHPPVPNTLVVLVDGVMRFSPAIPLETQLACMGSAPVRTAHAQSMALVFQSQTVRSYAPVLTRQVAGLAKLT